MNPMNSIIVEGNLTRNPEARMTPGGMPICMFSLAHNRYFKNSKEKEHHEEVSFFDVEVWAKQAEICEKYLEKGRGVRVVGRLKQDRWTDKEGQNRYKIKIVGEHIEFKSKPKTEEEKKDTAKELVETY